LWHDAIYNPTRSDNEEQSAELAVSELTSCGVDESAAQEVARLILLTKSHRVEKNDRLGALLISIDLSILGSSAVRYQQYVAEVRKEYAHVPDEAWRAGRSAVLRHLLDANPLYADPSFREHLEPQARRNMETELKSLIGG
jgi:predicted metal-dependent HD superfamily phosphohydrolase